MKYLIFFLIAFCSCHSNAPVTQESGPPVIRTDTVPRFCLRERQYLFSRITVPNCEINLDYYDSTEELYLVFRFPARLIPEKNLPDFRKRSDGFRSLVLDFVLGDTITHFAGMEYILNDPNPEKCDYLKHQILEVDTSASTFHEKLAYFCQATITDIEYKIDTATHTITFGINTPAAKKYATDNFFHTLTTSYAQLLYAYGVFRDNGYDHLHFAIRNTNASGVTGFFYDYYTTDPEIKNIKSIFPEYIYKIEELHPNPGV